MRAATWWIDRWRQSSAYMDMTLAEQGAYRNLLDELWLREGPIPNDERILGKACGDRSEWPTVREAVLGKFTLTNDGWTHATQEQILGQAQTYRESQAAKGRKGAEARWGKNRQKNGPANGPAINPANGPDVAQGMATGLRSQVSGNSAQNSEKDNDKSRTASPPRGVSEDEQRVFDLWLESFHKNGRTAFSKARLTRTRARIKKHGAGRVMEAVRGFALDDWRHDNLTRHDLKVLMRDDEQIETGCDYLENGPPQRTRDGYQSQETKRDVIKRALEDEQRREDEQAAAGGGSGGFFRDVPSPPGDGGPHQDLLPHPLEEDDGRRSRLR